MMYQTYLKDCECDGGGVIIIDNICYCRWCCKSYAKGGSMSYREERFHKKETTSTDNLEWHENNKTEDFKWTDELVKQYYDWCIGTKNEHRYTIEKFKQSKTIPKKEYEIESVILEGGYIEKNKSQFDYLLGHFEASPYKAKIHSVKRLSDGEVFAIGDNVKYGLACKNIPTEWFIDNFFIKHGNDDVLVRSKGNLHCEYLSTLKKAEIKQQPPTETIPINDVPCLSIMDVTSWLQKEMFPSTQWNNYDFKKLQELVKQKLNTNTI